MSNPLENPKLLLDHVVNLIARDIKALYALSEKGKLSSDNALDLVRYSGALLNISKDMSSDEDEFKKSLDKLSLEELLEKSKELEKKVTK